MRIFRALLIGAAAGLLAGVISFFLPRTYTATTRILPAASSTGGLQSLANATGISSIIEVAGTRQENPFQTYPEILLGRVVLERTLQRGYPPDGHGSPGTVLTALHVVGNGSRELAFRGVRELRRITGVAANPRTGIIAVSVETRDSVLSAYVANSLIDELDRFNLETRRSQGKALREFLSGRLDEAQRELDGSEQSLAAFRRSNLRIGNSAQLALEEERLKREVDIRSDLYRMLAREYESARIEEHRDTPTFSIVEPAVPPYRKSKPATTLNILGSAALAILISAFFDSRAVLFKRREAKPDSFLRSA